MPDNKPGWLARALYPDRGNPSAKHNDRRVLWVNPFQVNYTKEQNPYRFSEYFVWVVGGVRQMEPDSIHAPVDPGVQAMYSDRMRQENPAAWSRACQSINQDQGNLAHLTPEEATCFLTAYLGKPVEACALIEGYSISNGYPYCIMYWREANS